MEFNPEMLILARGSRRMTQKALADASETKQASISRAEAGVHVPVAANVEAWARALRYPVAFFAQHNDAPPLPRTFWRKQAKLGKTDQKEIEANIAIRCLNIETLARSIDLPEPNLQALTIGVDIGSAAEAARWLRTKWRVPSGPIPNLTRLLEDNGIVVVRLSDTGIGFNGASIWDVRRALPPAMFVWAGAPTDRDRWTLAHELGHMVLHHHLRVTEEECESEADEFAREFLMPAHEIRHHFSSRTGIAELAQLKLHWRTSMAALLRCGKALGRISEERGLVLYKTMSARGYRRSEPNPLSREEAALLREMVRVHLQDLEYSIEELAALLAIDVEEARTVFLGDSAQALSSPAPAPSPSPQPIAVGATAEAAPSPTPVDMTRPRLRLV